MKVISFIWFNIFWLSSSCSIHQDNQTGLETTNAEKKIAKIEAEYSQEIHLRLLPNLEKTSDLREIAKSATKIAIDIMKPHFALLRSVAKERLNTRKKFFVDRTLYRSGASPENVNKFITGFKQQIASIVGIDSLAGFGLWDPFATATRYRNMVVAQTIDASTLGKRLLLESIAPAEIRVINPNESTPVIGFVLGKELIIIHLKFATRGQGYLFEKFEWLELLKSKQ